MELSAQEVARFPAAARHCCFSRAENQPVAGDTRSLARDIGLEPRTTPIESPQSNRMAEAFVPTIKRDYVGVSPYLMLQLPSWITHYNEVHPHKAPGYRSPREVIAARGNP